MGADFFQSLTDIGNDLKTDRPHIGIGGNTIIRKSIIDKNVRIGKNVKLLNKDNIEFYDAPDRSFYIREGIIIVPKNAVIADGTEI
jgi:glucose-1-phosphate adenylyltransferase